MPSHGLARHRARHDVRPGPEASARDCAAGVDARPPSRAGHFRTDQLPAEG